MFWEKWIPEKYIVKPLVCGLEVLVTDSGIRFFYTIIHNKSNKLSIIECGSSENQFILPSIVKKNKIPLVVCITGKGLISKKATLPDNNINYEEILNQNLPAVNFNDFYAQIYPQHGCDAFITIFRKEKVDSILKVIRETKNEVAEVFLGYSFITDAVPITTLFESIQANNALIEFSNNCIESIKQEVNENNNVLKIEDLELNKTNVLGFALCFVYLLNATRLYNYNGLKEFKTNHLQRNKLRILTRAALGMAFLLCLVNFLCFNYYFGNNRKLESELSLYEGKYEKINELLKSYEKKRHLIEESGILNEAGFTQNIDKIAATIPKEVVLTDWIIDPIIKTDDEDSLIKFSKNIIQIKGNCNKSLIINEWINVLKSQNFIKDINLEKFAFSNEGNQPNFELKIITE